MIINAFETEDTEQLFERKKYLKTHLYGSILLVGYP